MERVAVSTNVNGTDQTGEVRPDESALTFLRDRLKLTGSKLGCGHGACGACTVSLDGTPVASCLLPATSMEGRKVRTVEGIGPDLHPVQRAFMACDALQCGYCTPGFIVEAVDFHDRWRKDNQGRPSRDDVAAALAGHLCRCGAYEAVFEAVQSACEGKYDGGDPEPLRVEARDKVTGAAKYTVDQSPDGMLEGRILRSPYAHARVVKLDWSKALAMEGVHGATELLTASRLVRYAGQEIVAIAAVDAHVAEAALKAVEIDYKILPAVVGMEAARAEGAAVVYPTRRDRKKLPNANEAPAFPVGWKGNVRGPFRFMSKKKRKALRAIESADTLVKETWRTQVQCHTSLEPHACVAQWDGDRLTVWLSTQAVHHSAKDIAQRWKLRPENVRVIAEHVGGGFGSKGTLSPETAAAVDLARETKRPVRVVLDRREEIMVGGNRAAQEIEVSLAVNADGNPSGIRVEAYADAGVAIGSIVGIFFRIMYPGIPKYLADHDVVTHGPPGKPFRGPGGAPAFWALEQAVDMMAEKRSEDPIAFRRRMSPSPIRESLYQWVEGLPVWKDRGDVASDKGRFRRGVGLATGSWFCFAEPATRVKVETKDGEIVASTACQDMGNGVRTSIAKAVADVFELRPTEVRVRIGESDLEWGPMSAGSRTTASVVPAAEEAAIKIRDRLASRKGDASWREFLKKAPPVSEVGKRRRDKGGYFLPFKLEGLVISRALTASAMVTEVEVDTLLGRVRVLRTWGGFAAGRIVVPELARSQAQGGIIQGMSYALYEERRLDPKTGALLTGGLEDYRIAGIGDIPEIHIHFIEEGFDKVTGRLVGLGELTTLAPAASIGNAIHHATGWRPMEMPLRPDRVLEGLRG